jgi:hypothetical protein
MSELQHVVIRDCGYDNHTMDEWGGWHSGALGQTDPGSTCFQHSPAVDNGRSLHFSGLQVISQ